MPGQNSDSTAGRAILLVEDNDSLREVLTESLTLLGYKVFAASRGEEAVAVAREIGEEIGLVISDLVMPGINALQLYEALGVDSGGGRMLVITGYPMPHTGASLVMKSGVRWASKPISLAQLEELVGDMLNQ